MLIIDVIYTKPLEEIDKYLVAHRAFLQRYYDLGILIASGPKNPRVGGIIIALGSQEAIEKILQEDPFYQHELASYKITEFQAVKYCEALKGMV